MTEKREFNEREFWDWMERKNEEGLTPLERAKLIGAACWYPRKLPLESWARKLGVILQDLAARDP